MNNGSVEAIALRMVGCTHEGRPATAMECISALSQCGCKFYRSSTSIEYGTDYSRIINRRGDIISGADVVHALLKRTPYNQRTVNLDGEAGFTFLRTESCASFRQNIDGCVDNDVDTYTSSLLLFGQHVYEALCPLYGYICEPSLVELKGADQTRNRFVHWANFFSARFLGATPITDALQGVPSITLCDGGLLVVFTATYSTWKNSDQKAFLTSLQKQGLLMEKYVEPAEE